MSDRPEWPAWFAPVGLLAAYGFALIGAAMAAALVAATGGAADSPGALRLATLVQDTAFVLVPLWLASMVAPPRAADFGLRRPRLWRAVGISVLAVVAFLAFGIAYSEIVGEPETQTTLEDLGAEDSGSTLLAVGIMVIVLAPLTEEFLFRGFFYTALRSRFGILAAALIDGVVFGAIHVFVGPEAVPPLIVFGFLLCLVYELTGSLWPPIILHALNNWVGYASQTDEAATASVIGLTMIASCIVLAAAGRPASRPVA